RTVGTARTPAREASSSDQRRSSADAAGVRLGRERMGRQDAGGLDPAAIQDRFRRAAVSTFVPAVGLSTAQTASCHCSGRSRTAEGAYKKLQGRMGDNEVDLCATDEVHFQQHGSRCRMWVTPVTRDLVLL